jgi:ketosteroid isomerase-like protein
MPGKSEPPADLSPLELAERYVAATEAGDIEALRRLYAPDAVIWHNFDDLEKTVDEHMAMMGWVVENITGFRYDEIRRQRTDTGFVQQHRARGTLRDGSAFDLATCAVFEISGGRISRLDDYLDSAGQPPGLPPTSR